MAHPPSSYLSPAALDGALQLARDLRDAADDIRVLVSGATIGPGGGGGRIGAAAMAMREWIGPHRDTFEQLLQHEVASAESTQRRLDDEADAWARFWAEATNARRQRQFDEAMSDHRRAMHHYEGELSAYQVAIETDPSAMIHLSAPPRPVAPTPPISVGVPTAATGYQPTG